eukprot:c23681_g1_i1 orf=161-2512(+)
MSRGLLQVTLRMRWFVFYMVLGYWLVRVAVGEEREVLMRVKAALDPEGHVLHSWVVPAGVFEGVAWNGEGKVANISLQGRGLQGFIPSAIAELDALTGLYLHYNKLRGPIPAVLYKLSSLTDLYLDVNLLTGTIPAELGLLYKLQALQLCCNALEGGIPMELGALKQLNVLALQHNNLVGEIPPSLGYLVALSRLDLSFNRLNGTIPVSLERLTKLTIVDVRSNSLSGPVPPALRKLQQGFVYGNNSILCGDGFSSLLPCSTGATPTMSSTTQVNPDQPIAGAQPPSNVSSAAESADPQYSTSAGQKLKVGTKTAQVAVVSGVVAFAVGGVLIGMLIFVLFRRHKQRISSAFELSDSLKLGTLGAPFSSELKPFSGVMNNNYQGSKANKLHSETHMASTSAANHRASRSFGSFSGVVFFNGSHQSFQYDLEELEVATNFFSDKNLLGKRAGHSAVYKGVLRDGSSVAIRALHKASCKTGLSEFKSVVGIIAQLRHENIVALKGFCCSSSKADCFLVYDFMTNGTLQEHLDRRSAYSKTAKTSGNLDWAARARIAINIARGLHFMHKGTDDAVIHQNVSAANVLLDQNCNAFLSDAGLHRLLVDDIVFSVLKASAARGYLSPEYVTTGRLTEKSDVYALGVLLLQLLTGKTPQFAGAGGHEQVDDEKEVVGDIAVRQSNRCPRRDNCNNMVSWARSLVGAGCVEELMDPSLKGKYSSVAATHMAAVAFACTQEDSGERPDSSEVVSLLEKMDDASALTAGLSSGEDYPRRQQALFAERLLDNGR